MSINQPKWLPQTTPPPDDLNSIPLPFLPNSDLASSSSTTLYPRSQPQTQSQATKQNNLNVKPSSTSSTPPALPTSATYAETNNINTSTTLHTTVNGGAGYLPSERPSGVPRCIVRVDRDHDAGDEATRFEAEMFPIEFVGRVNRPEFTATVNGINECMRVAEESILNCLDALLDCLTAYTAKHCCGTHYQRALRKMETFIHHENERVYHPARIHLRDPQKVGMIYLEFEVF
ncbi:Golgin sub A member 7 [Podila minutissima]|uniref:Ras modification protein ERF4 n=1 Tax=Podila minutissima TaxID=64525 RepID=A0A9P5SQB5_9FUNG|nr:Golgin sub A member 7 [Podila minutissima]